MQNRLAQITALTLLLSTSCQAAQKHPEKITSFETINAGGYKGVTKITMAQLKLYQALNRFNPESKTTHIIFKRKPKQEALFLNTRSEEEQVKIEERLARRAALLSPSCSDLSKKQEQEKQAALTRLNVPDRPASPKATWAQQNGEQWDTTSPYIRCDPYYWETEEEQVMRLIKEEERYPFTPNIAIQVTEDSHEDIS